MNDQKMTNIRPQVLQKIERILKESTYRDAIENSAKYNNRLVVDRKTRLPFIDSQTGVAQRDCYLWMQRWQRMPGTNYGQLYTYPAHKWKKRRRGYLFRETYYPRSQVTESSGEVQETGSGKGNGQEGGMGLMKSDGSTVGSGGGGREGGTGGVGSESNQNSSDKFVENSKDAWIYAEYDDSIDMMEAFGCTATDGSDYDESSRSKKKRARRKKVDQGDKADRYACDLCDARYKTRPGINYHYATVHYNETDKRPKSSTPLPTIDEDEPKPLIRLPSSSGNQKQSSGKSLLVPPNPYCDFCLADEKDKSKSREKMISCTDCGRSAHPSCLQFTPQMITAVAKYRWQCIECKSCGFCGTSDNDDQLLFCDDCDRGYHMFCLEPPIKEPPEGTWICVLCTKKSEKKNETDSTKKDLPEKDNSSDKEENDSNDQTLTDPDGAEASSEDKEAKEKSVDDSIEEKLESIFNRGSKK